MTNPTYEGFIDFINEQDPDKVINHWDGWTKCAVGQYLAMALGYSHPHNVTFIILCDTFARDHIRGANEELFFLLNTDAEEVLPTYGKLQEWLKNQ